MRAAQRAQEFRAVQRESTQVVAVLRKVLFSLGQGDASSPVPGAFSGQFVPLPMGLEPITVGAAKVTDRRNSRLRCYFRHCG